MKRLMAIDRQTWVFIVVVSILAFVLVFIGIKFILPGDIFKKNTDKTEIEKKVDSYINLQLAIKGYSGSILIARKGEILLNKGYGMANYELNVPNSAQTKCTIASISKTFTAAAVLKLEETGRLSINDKLNRYIPDYPSGDKIKVEDLLKCTSGIPDYTETLDLFENARKYRSLQELIELFKNKPLEFEPGSKFKYSNSNYVLLGYIVEKITGESLEQYLKNNFFNPLNMQDTGLADNRRIISNRASGYTVMNRDLENCDFSDITFHIGAGGLYSTTGDLYKWDRALKSGKILSKQSLDKMFTPKEGIFGMGWLIMDAEIGDMKKKLIKTSGLIFGFDCTVDRYVDDDVVIIVLSNIENFAQGSRVGEISQKLAAIVFDNE